MQRLRAVSTVEHTGNKTYDEVKHSRHAAFEAGVITDASGS
jgi:hypothetical protein